MKMGQYYWFYQNKDYKEMLRIIVYNKPDKVNEMDKF